MGPIPELVKIPLDASVRYQYYTLVFKASVSKESPSHPGTVSTGVQGELAGVNGGVTVANSASYLSRTGGSVNEQLFRSESGISVDGGVIITIFKLTRPACYHATGSVYNEPFCYTATTQIGPTGLVSKLQEDRLYDRFASSRNDIDEAIANVLARLAL